MAATQYVLEALRLAQKVEPGKQGIGDHGAGRLFVG
jgi:hypothetical protein